MSHVQGGFTANYPHMLDEVSTHIAYVLEELGARGATTVEVSQEAEDAWVQEIVDSARDMRAFQESCTPGYYNNEGNLDARGGVMGSYGKGNIAFFALLAEWRDTGTLPGLEIT